MTARFLFSCFLSNSPLLSRKWTHKLFTLFIHKVPRGCFMLPLYSFPMWHGVRGASAWLHTDPTIDQQAPPGAEREMELHPSWDTFPPKQEKMRTSNWFCNAKSGTDSSPSIWTYQDSVMTKRKCSHLKR